jgi:hypothetical protein
MAWLTLIPTIISALISLAKFLMSLNDKEQIKKVKAAAQAGCNDGFCGPVLEVMEKK